MQGEQVVQANDVQLVTVDQAARMLAISRAKLYAMMEAEELEWVKLGKSRRIKIQSIRDLVSQNTVSA